MHKKDFKKGIKVYDHWWPWNIGVVKKVFKTRVKINFYDEIVSYDLAHLQFLEKVT